ncbi:MAG: 50S ribosomal protein L21 [Candidatus Shapirobacteria bacterium]
MNYAIIALGGQQHQLTEGQVFQIPHLESNQSDKIELTEVLLLSFNDQITVGTPYVPNCSVQLEVVNHLKGLKTKIFKYKAKSRYHKTMGFRPSLTELKVIKISTGDQPKKEAVAKKTVTSKKTVKKVVKVKDKAKA